MTRVAKKSKSGKRNQATKSPAVRKVPAKNRSTKSPSSPSSPSKYSSTLDISAEPILAEVEIPSTKTILTKPAIRRLCRAAGVKRIASEVYDFVDRGFADIIEFSIDEVISSSNGKNINLEDVDLYYNEKFAYLDDSSNLNLKSRYRSFSNKVANKEKITETYMLKSPFSRYVKSVAKNRGYKFTEKSILLFQFGCEVSLIALFESAYLSSILNKRITLMNKDLELAIMILSKCPIVTSPRSVACRK
jgi:histone H3/H4